MMCGFRRDESPNSTLSREDLANIQVIEGSSEGFAAVREDGKALLG